MSVLEKLADSKVSPLCGFLFFFCARVFSRHVMNSFYRCGPCGASAGACVEAKALKDVASEVQEGFMIRIFATEHEHSEDFRMSRQNF